MLSRVNRHHTPYWSVVVHVAAAAPILVAAAGEEQELVLFRAVAVLVSFLVGLVAMAHFVRREGKKGLAWANSLAATAVAFTLMVNLMRGWPVLSLAATVLIAGGLYVRWTRAGRPTGIEDIESRAEAGRHDEGLRGCRGARAWSRLSEGDPGDSPSRSAHGPC